jgi:L-ascorbate metabolism protein UlaG (beta-lactamase superfamily)
VRFLKYSHACVRIESDAAVLVIDPGALSEPAALDGVDAVLITHEHFDHVDVDMLADALAKRPLATVHTNESVAAKLTDLTGVVTTVRTGQAFEAAGMRISAHGGWHAEIHPDIPRVPNLGYLVEDLLYHPGDSFDVPESLVGSDLPALFVPVSGPWLKMAESVAFVRTIRPQRVYALHDSLLNDAGLTVTDANLSRLAQCQYARLAPGESVTLR